MDLEASTTELTPTITAPVIEFVDVKKAFGSQRVLRGLSLSVPRNRITFIIGRSGEGKSVTLKHIVGILHPNSGTIRVLGREVKRGDRAGWAEVRKGIGLLFQDGALFDSLTVFENVAFPLREAGYRDGAKLNTRVADLLEQVGLPGLEQAFPATLSIGEKKRVGLARALALQPEILLYDEPTTSMDPLVSELIDNLIVETQKKNPSMTSVVISHDLPSILGIAEYIVLLHEGRAYAQGTPEEFRVNSDPVVRQFLSGDRNGPLSNVIA